MTQPLFGPIEAEISMTLTYANWTELGFLLTDMGEDADDIILMGEYVRPEEEPHGG